MSEDRVAWMGQMTDGRVLGHWQDVPPDAPQGKRWQRAWACIAKRCKAPAGVVCHCRGYFT